MRKSHLITRWSLYLAFVVSGVLLILIFYPSSSDLKVREVQDGDTIILTNGEKVRYIGIDTPEKAEPLYSEAAKANKEMLKGEKITLEYDLERQDDWGRTLAYVWVDSVLINAELIKKGLAWVYLFSPNLKYRDQFIYWQKQAREKKMGIWSVPSSPENYYVATKHSQRFVFHRPECEWAKKIKRENLIRFETREEALDSGYSPCRACKP